MYCKGHYYIVLLFAVVFLSACGGGGGGNGSGSTGSSITSVGRVDGFGSVYVNGVEYDTSHTRYRVDDEDGYDDSVLAVGMKVRVEGQINADGVTGRADSIYYDDDLEGPIDSGSVVENGNTKTFTVLGTGVSVDANTTVFHDGASFAGLVDGVEIEISGFFDGDILIASRIELQSDSNHDYEIKGTLTQFDGVTVTIELRNGAQAGPYAVSGSARIDLPSDPIGSYVEIKLVDTGGTLEAVRIERDDRHLVHEHDHYVSLRGVVSGNPVDGFSIDGVPFEVSPATRYEPATLAGNLSAGMVVEVKGDMSSGTLIATKIEAKYAEAEVKARVVSVVYSDGKNGTVTLDLGNSQTIAVYTDNATSFEDSASSHRGSESSFLLSDLTDADFVEVEISSRDAGYYAQSIERKGYPQATQVQARVEAMSADSVTVLGVTFMIDGSTSISGTPQVGDKVEIYDKNADGTADRIELESRS